MANRHIGKTDPLRVAVVGAGPAGFYAAEALLERPNMRVEVDLYERLPAPYGLVRYGVAPDHQKIKGVSRIYDRIATREGFRLRANVQVGKDVIHAELLEHYHQVVYTVGCEVSRMLDVPGEDLDGVHGATSFVNWYNGHPDFRGLDVNLEEERAVVVGIGDVAMDVTRILVQDPDVLARTDIAEEAMEVIRGSRVQEVVMLARRGPCESAFATRELSDIAELEGVDVVVDEADMKDALLVAEGLGKKVRKKVQLLAELGARPRQPGAKRVVFRFLRSPVEILGEQGRVERIRLEENELVRGRDQRARARGTGHTEELDAGLVIRSIGYRGIPIDGVPFDLHTGRIPNVDGRVTLDDSARHFLPRTYAAGWIKRGATGLVGANKACAHDTVEHMMDDLGSTSRRWPDPAPAGTIDTILEERNVRVIDFDEWKRMDAHEVELGEARGKIREKLVDRSDVFAFLDGTPSDHAVGEE